MSVSKKNTCVIVTVNQTSRFSRGKLFLLKRTTERQVIQLFPSLEYLGNIFLKMNEINLRLWGKNLTVFVANDRIEASSKKCSCIKLRSMRGCLLGLTLRGAEKCKHTRIQSPVCIVPAASNTQRLF